MIFSPSRIESNSELRDRRKMKEIIYERRKRKCFPSGRDSIRSQAVPPATFASIIPRSRHSSEHAATPDSRFSILDTRTHQFRGVLDDCIDARDSEEPRFVTEYVQDMYGHFRAQETCVGPNYIMNDYSHMHAEMRSILVDWIIEVHCKWDLVPETLYLTVNLLDRFLAKEGKTVARTKLVGVTCLLIASKYEESCAPLLSEITRVCDNVYSRNEVLAMEANILETLEFRVTAPTSFTFLLRFLKAAKADRTIVRNACYILDGTLQSTFLLRYLPSQLAAASVSLARQESGWHPWSPTLLKYSLYCEEKVAPVADAIWCEQASISSHFRSLHRKYNSVPFEKTSRGNLIW